MRKILVLVLIGFYVVSCNNGSSFDKEKYLQEGKQIAQSTGKLLTAKVKTTIKAQGPFQAINFCNVNAYPLTDSLSGFYGVDIKRIAVKYRNPENKANEHETLIINNYMAQTQKGEALKPIVEKNDDGVYFYAPIKVKHACLTCHGAVGSEIPDTLFNHIKELYPNDLATAFKEGDLRGIWSIRF